ncbi:MAG TPA: CaiB/BaiF CoA-transferase family protein [Dehalococcoidia bacterium]|nr:CaiB/BaiF CoA-transferase family protein [Dehalococcoidia bacterium]
MADSLPLAGIKVFTLEQAVAAPLCTRHLVDLGAEVIKVERRGEGDFARAYDTAIHGMSTYFAWLNRGKKSITLDITQPKGQEIAHRIISSCDVVVQNFAPGALDRRGLGVGQLHERYPRLIACSLTGYGEDGPYRDRKAYDALVQAEAGVFSITGTPEAPSKAGIPVVDFSSGVYALSSILAALYRRQLTGEGAAIRISLFDAIMEWMGIFALQARHGSKPQRSGAFHPNIVPYGPYKAKDGVVMLSIQNEREWANFCEQVVNRPEWITHPEFGRGELRLKNRKVLEPLIEEALADITVEEAEARLEKASIAYARSNDVSEVLDHPQLHARGRLMKIPVPGGEVEVLKAPFNIEGVEDTPKAVPAVGQHNDEVLREAGYSKDEIKALKEEGII